MNPLIPSIAASLLFLASSAALAAPTTPSPEQFRAYWNQGKAEITHYALKQARYGDTHDGRSVLVFVTEPFSRKKQVKLDAPRLAGDDAVEVLKLNHTRKFNTGLYPYSTMRSVFAPVERAKGPALKVTTSIQEWCGHVFMQLNRRQGKYEGPAFSYFESEGDRALSIPEGTVLEDAVWTTLRIDPRALPMGEVSMLPSTFFLRLRHVPARPQKAMATLTKDGPTYRYSIEYPALGRKVSIDFEAEFPFRITGWTESTASGRALTTVATRKNSLMIDYWNRNGPQDRALRTALDLPRDY